MITIAIPTYKRIVYIGNVLLHCVEQTHEDLEILISDSSPHDEIRNIAESFRSPKIRFLKQPEETTLTDKLNGLVREARGDHMLILCDDDLLDREYCRNMHRLTCERPDATLYRCRYRLIDGDGGLIRLDNELPSYLSPGDFLRRVFLKEKDFFKMNISGILFPRELFLKLGGFVDLEIPWHTERIAWCMLAARGGCASSKDPLCSVRLHSGSITSSFGTDLSASLDSDLKARNIFESVIDKAEAATGDPQEHKYFSEARENLRIYMNRHLSRSLDHGFLSSLGQRKDTHTSMQRLFEKMEALQVPEFPSAKVYYYLSHIPFTLRRPFIQAMKHYKVTKWCA